MQPTLCCLTLYNNKNYLNRICMFFKRLLHVQDPLTGSSVAHTSQVRASVMLVLLIARN
jgi:hypothetical protein